MSESPTHPDAPRAPTGDEGCLDWTAADRADFDARVIAGASTTGLNRDALASPDAPRAGGETPPMDIDETRDLLLHAAEVLRCHAADTATPFGIECGCADVAQRLDRLRASLLARHRDGETADLKRRIKNQSETIQALMSWISEQPNPPTFGELSDRCSSSDEEFRRSHAETLSVMAEEFDAEFPPAFTPAASEPTEGASHD